MTPTEELLIDKKVDEQYEARKANPNVAWFNLVAAVVPVWGIGDFAFAKFDESHGMKGVIKVLVMAMYYLIQYLVYGGFTTLNAIIVIGILIWDSVKLSNEIKDYNGNLKRNLEIKAKQEFEEKGTI